MIGDLFDSPWKILILAVVVIVLFGSRKLPDAARSLGKSMRILKTEIHDFQQESAGAGSASAPPPGIEAGGTAPELAEQAAALQRQLDELRRPTATG